MKKIYVSASILLSISGILFFSGYVFAQTVPTSSTSTDTPTPPVDDVEPTMPVGPSVSSVSVTDITDTSARIDIDSDEMVQGYVEYGTTEQYGMSTPLTSEFSTSPSFLLEGLTPKTLYHYRVVVMDSAGNAAITSDETFTTLATPQEPEPTPAPTDTSTSTSTSTATPPATGTGTTTTTTESTPTATSDSTSSPQATPSSPALAISSTETVSISTSTASITWQTNRSADSQVEYGTTNAYGALSPVGTFSTSHSVGLSGLMSNTKYYYRAISKTSSGEIAYGSSQQFTTLAPPALSPPVISNVSITVSTSSVTITWTTSNPATSNIQYGTTTSYGFTLGKDATLKTSHSRTISNLPASSLFHFRLVVADGSGTTALGKDRTCTTNAAIPVSSGSTSTASRSAEILSNIAKQASQAATSAPQGGGGIPVVPTHPLLLKVTPLDRQVSFDWRKDTGIQNGTIHTLIVKKEGPDPVRSRIDGTIIYDGPSTTFTDTDVENGKEYHYALYSYGQYGRFTVAARFKVVPQAGEEQIDLAASETQEVTVPLLPRDLFKGKQGDDVATLQAYLAGNGYYPEGLVTGYFGSLTHAAVLRYQRLNDITPVAGYVGPLTREALGR